MLLWYSSFVLYIEFSYAIEEKKRKTLFLPDTWGWHKKISYNHLQCVTLKGFQLKLLYQKKKKKKLLKIQTVTHQQLNVTVSAV